MVLSGISRFRLAKFMLALLPMVASAAWAQLKSSAMLGENVPESVRKETATFMSGDEVTSRPDLEVVVEGNAELRKTQTVILAKRIELNQVTDIAKMTGDVRVNQAGNRFWGPELSLGIDDFAGFFTQPNFHFYKNDGQGDAQRIEFVSERSMIAKFANYSTCKRPQGENGKPWKPDWIIIADQIDFDLQDDVATASGVTLRFKDVPVLSIPSVSFPMNDDRKSGFLAPTIGSDSLSGVTVTQPYYWNIAPNRDATFSPTMYTNRGFDLGAEFRYLEPNSSGLYSMDYLPNDKVFGGSRWGLAVDERAIFRSPLANVSDVNMRLTVDRVSDNNYWSDFSSLGNPLLTQRLLNNELNMTGKIDGWTSMFRIQRWQTIQDPLSPITPPFDRTEFSTNRNFDLPDGFKAKVNGDMTSFRSDPTLTLQPDGNRLVGTFELSRPWTSRSGFITPKVLLNVADYQLNTPVAGLTGLTGTTTGTTGTTGTSIARFIPTFSLDTGLFFERDAHFFNGNYTQTLEPRLMYVRTPYRDQSGLPNYDSAVKSYSLTTIYSENMFSGSDRISDMDMLILGASTRILDPKTGVQLLSAGIAQQYSLANQYVTVPGVPLSSTRLNDLLVNTNFKLNSWTFDGTVQFPENSSAAQTTTLTTQYKPSNYRVFSAAYRMQQGVGIGTELGQLGQLGQVVNPFVIGMNEQVDLNWQWPLGDFLGRADENSTTSSAGRGLGANRWYTVAHLNYSLSDQRMVNSIIGVEYDADCWVGRIVMKKTQIDVNTTDRSLMFQIEFVGFSRVGVSPLASLRSNIPGYQNLREQITSPSRFSQYD